MEDTLFDGSEPPLVSTETLAEIFDAEPLTAPVPAVETEDGRRFVLVDGQVFEVDGNHCSCGNRYQPDTDDFILEACIHQKKLVDAEQTGPCTNCGAWIATAETRRSRETGEYITRWSCRRCGKTEREGERRHHYHYNIKNNDET